VKEADVCIRSSFNDGAGVQEILTMIVGAECWAVAPVPDTGADDKCREQPRRQSSDITIRLTIA
jgi:hypothetical protein